MKSIRKYLTFNVPKRMDFVKITDKVEDIFMVNLMENDQNV